MDIRISVAAVILFFTCLPAVDAQEYGKIRALHQRAASVIKQKNDFVARVLTSYRIPHERNAQGVVVRISMDGRWLEVTAIDIVPLLQGGTDRDLRVAAHELLFTTSGGTLDLVSELIVR